jgi:site-specific DNA recombinase
VRQGQRETRLEQPRPRRLSAEDGLPKNLLSSKDQEKEGFSIPAQLRLLREYATSRGVVIAAEFVDVESSKTGDGNGFTRPGSSAG